MKDVILEFLKRECVTSVLSITEVAYRDLFCIEIRYVKGDRAYNTRVYYTLAWVSSSPLGPPPMSEEEAIEYMSISTLRDIADVKEYSSVLDLKKTAKITDDDLSSLYSAFDAGALVYAQRLLNPLNFGVLSVQFLFLPRPMVMAAVDYRGSYVGSMSIDMSGGVELISCYNPVIKEAVVKLQKRQLNPVKEFESYEWYIC